MRAGVYLYGPMESAGAKALAAELGIKRIKNENSAFKGSPKKTVIVWGSTQVPREVSKCRMVNLPPHILTACNKLEFFQALNDTECRIVPYTTNIETVKEWLKDGSTVCARQKLRASGADGLVLFDGADDVPRAPLYTRYVKKKEEFRIHILNKEVISVQRKAFKKAEEGEEPVAVDKRIRNLANGYIFARNDIVVPDDVITQAKRVFDTLPLDFGAVDVIFNQKQAQAYVLEVNTAPGLEGTTVKDYAKAFEEFLK